MSDEIFKKLQSLKPQLDDFKLKRFSVFGSRARGDFSERSDLDILIDPVPGFTLYDMANVKRALEEVCGVPVDVVTRAGAEQNQRFKHIIDEAIDV